MRECLCHMICCLSPSSNRPVLSGEVVSFKLPDVGEGIQTVEIKEWYITCTHIDYAHDCNSNIHCVCIMMLHTLIVC